MMPRELPSTVLSRRAVVYVRQSNGAQVQENRESQRQQYALGDLARASGFQDVQVIDDDLGRSASGAMDRPGFGSLVGQICEGLVGAVFSASMPHAWRAMVATGTISSSCAGSWGPT
jgi:resolvase-like protein